MDRIHLHSVDVSDSVPQPLPGDHGLPGQLLVVGANRADFSDAKANAEYTSKRAAYDTGPIIARKIPGNHMPLRKAHRAKALHRPVPIQGHAAETG